MIKYVLRRCSWRFFFTKNKNGDSIKDDYGQTLDDEDHKPWNTLWSWVERPHFLWVLLASLKITGNNSVWEKMEYEFIFLN